MMGGRRPKCPREPAPSECCGSGCTRCVWDVYFDNLAKYEESIQALKAEGIDPEDEENVDSDTSSVSEESDKGYDYIGCVVVKYVDPPSNEDLCITPSLAVSRLLGRFSTIHDVKVLRSSRSSLNKDDPSREDQAIQVVNVLLNGDSKEEDGVKTAPVLPQPGDFVEIFVPNDSDMDSSGRCGEVEELCSRLGVNPSAWCEIHRSPFVPSNYFPYWLPFQRRIQIRTLFTYFVDISSCSYLLRPTFFQTLFHLATSSKSTPVDTACRNASGSMELLSACAAKEVAPLIYKAITNGGANLCYPRLVDLLDAFPLVKLPIARLLEVSGPLRPRKFSVVSHTPCDSTGEEPLRSVELCVRRVDVSEVECKNVEGESKDTVQLLARLLREIASRRCSANGNGDYLFTGHVSHPLCSFHSRPHAAPMYVGTNMFGTTQFAKELKRSLFPLAAKSAAMRVFPSLILVGAGTGIAPLISVVNELARRRRHHHHHDGHSCTGSWMEFPSCWVVYGAKDMTELVFHDELQEALKSNTISRYDVALSRVNEGAYPKYVTDVLESHTEDVRSALIDKEARLFACGPVAALRSLRHRLMHHILPSSDDQDDESVREQRVLLLEKKGQLMFDVWGPINIFE